MTPGADDFGEAAAGGMAGIAYTVAEKNARESGLEAMSGHPEQGGYSRQQQQGQEPSPALPAPPAPQQQSYQGYPRDAGPYAAEQQDDYGGGGQEMHGQSAHGGAQDSHDGYYHPPGPGAAPGAGYSGIDHDSHSSLAALGASAALPGRASPEMMTPGPGRGRPPSFVHHEVYTDDPYQRYSHIQDARLGVVNPMDIEDDGDEGLEYGRQGNRASMLSLGQHSSRSGHTGAAAVTGAAAAGVAGATAAAAALGAIASKAGGAAARNGGSGGQYGPVTEYYGAGGSMHDLGSNPPEKSQWLAEQRSSSRKWTWIIVAALGLAAVAGIVLGVVFGVVLKHKDGAVNSEAGSSGSAAGDTSANGDLNLNSPEIQALLNNKNLHKVFPGIDYTPINTQYPDCLTFPPSQNNVTRDMAVLSQLTNTVRLYGTDCNQTEMVLHAISQLQMNDTMKLWMGVWQDNNSTTNARQLAQMWDILDTYGGSQFVGVIVANEILFREQMTVSQLSDLLTTVRSNMTSRGLNLPVATSDLGDNWTTELAEASDLIMANIHPFFAGVPSTEAASWTYSFWSGNDGPFWKSNKNDNIIAETGWPSQGGTDCGTDLVTTCPNGSVAAIEGMNNFMSDWVCQALANGTQYFWFEAFDEPWKIIYDTPGEAWEDHWGLMDVDRNLKSGVTIPDCNGQTV